MNISAVVIRVSIYCIDFIDRLHIVSFDILVILIVLFLYIFLNAALIDYNYRDHCAMNLNSMSVTAFVCTKKFEPGTPGLSGNHATNELSWRHDIYFPSESDRTITLLVHNL